MDSSRILNDRLRNLYQGCWGLFEKNIPRSKDFSYPHFIFVPDAYIASKIKLLVVGQQTYGWDFNKGGLSEDLGDDPVGKIMGLYAGFSLGKLWRHTPFWQAAHELYCIINPDGPENGFLWSNLVKIDEKGKRPDSHIEEAVSQLKLLPEEISITKPDAVVFLTGPSYNDRLKSIFERVQHLPTTDDSVTRVVHPLLPPHSFQTYHPKYLKLSKKWGALKMIASTN